MQAHTPLIAAPQPAPLSSSATSAPSPGGGKLAEIFQLASQICEVLLAASIALDDAHKIIDDSRKNLGHSSPAINDSYKDFDSYKDIDDLPCSSPAATPAIPEEISIITLLPLTAPVHTTPAAANFSPLPSYAHITIIISDYEPNATACWDIGPLNEFRAAMRGGKQGKDVGLWRGWKPDGAVASLGCIGDGEDRGAFASTRDADEGKEDGDEDEDEEDGCGKDDDEEGCSSSDDNDSESDDYYSEEYDSDDYDDNGIDIVFG
jgi:hypothetical protein